MEITVQMCSNIPIIKSPMYGMEPDSKYGWIMKERKEREKAGKSIQSIFLSVQQIESLGIRDYNNDGFEEIITQNAIFLEDAHIYIGSLYTVYRPGNLSSKPASIFILDRYGISSREVHYGSCNSQS
jgi:hypothetical protein